MLAAPAWAINKCTGDDGRPVYQDAPCAGKGEVLKIRPTGGQVSGMSPSSAIMLPFSSVATVPNPPALKPQEVPQPIANKSALEMEADTCMEFIKPRLKDPSSPYHLNVNKEGTVVSFDLFAKNSFGGYTSKAAACEIKNSRLDEGWTNIHLKRLGW